MHQLGAHRSAGARALLLDQEALRLGLEDVAGYNPVHLKRYNRLMLASNGGRAVDRHFEFALRYATPQLRSLAVRYYVSPPGRRRRRACPSSIATASASSRATTRRCRSRASCGRGARRWPRASSRASPTAS